MKVPKYSISFLIIIISLKIIYLIVEVYYNGHLIDVISSSNITIKTLENIEEFGHSVSSIGLTLLLTPFFYLAIKKAFKTNTILTFIATSSFMIVSFFTFKILLVFTMDKIIEKNSDKRHSSYYISAFKYGMLNNQMGYETFIPRERLKNLNIEDRIIISNMFLLTLIDKSLTDKLVNKGQDIFVDLFIKRYDFENYQESKRTFENKYKK